MKSKLTNDRRIIASTARFVSEIAQDCGLAEERKEYIDETFKQNSYWPSDCNIGFIMHMLCMPEGWRHRLFGLYG